jgi:hypothetical protein
MPRLALVLTLLLACCAWTRAQGYATKHVVIVVIDGARYSETLGDTSYANQPRMGRLMAPLGARAPCWNDGVTVTIPGHAAILCGVYQPLANDGTERPHLPTLFEYWRKSTGAPAAQTWFLAGKAKLAVMSNSDHADYGAAYAAQFSANDVADTQVMTLAEAQLLSGHPVILAMNLADTDRIAHTGDWAGYLRAILVADSLVYDLWTKIQADTALAGRTTLFVTNDHGRHDDAHGGFQNHGDGCDGCRHVELLVMGPDTRKGYVSATRMQQIGIAPLCGRLLGIPTPYAADTAMNELLLGTVDVRDGPVPPRLWFAPPVPNPSRGVVSLALDVPGSGTLLVDVLDAQGRRVAVLEQGGTGPGRRLICWTGTTGSGPRAAAGTYFIRARMSGWQASARVVLR